MTEWTEQQRRVIESRGENLIVSAGAGSGKTAVMIERICTLLEEGADLRRMAVSTFTNAAAADMRRKLADNLTARLRARDNPHLRRQLGFLPSADISTLHAWCAHIVKAWFFDCDVDPEFGILEEGEAYALKIDAAEQLIEEEKTQGDEAFAGLYTAFVRRRSHRALTEAILSVYDYASAQPDPAGWLRRSARKTSDEYRALLREGLAAEATRLAKAARQLSQDMAARRFEKEIPLVGELMNCMARQEVCATRAPALRNTSEFIDLHERFKALKGAYAALHVRRVAIDEMPACESSLVFCRALADLAEKLNARYSAAKSARAKLDYADLEHCTLSVLRGEHGGDIVAAYDYVFVDEYQDINPLQEEILRLFSCKMFFVGDIKQSIYGFRMCRPGYFIEKFRRYAANTGEGRAYELTRNFRSGGEILDFVNDVFSRMMTDTFGGVDYAQAKFDAGCALPAEVRSTLIDVRDEKAEPPHGVYSVRADAGERTGRGLDAETDAVTDEIIGILQSGKVPDGEENGAPKFRPAAPEDIAVLVRGRSAFTDALERKLRAHSLPVAFVSSDTTADSFRSVAVLIAMLRVLDNARDDVHLAAVMLSPMFGAFTAEELSALRTKEGAFCDCVSEAAARQPKVEKFLSQIEALRRKSESHTVAELAGEITSRFDCFSAALAEGGEREAAALDAYLEHLAALTEYDTLHAYLRLVSRTGLPSLKVRDCGRAVRIMTIHASKGLEFPFVILPNLHRRFNLSDTYARVLCDSEEGVVLRTFDFRERAVRVNPRYAVCADALRRDLKAEELRILYVAMTRAMVRLSLYARLPSATDDGETDDRGADDSVCYLDWLYPFIRASARIFGETEDVPAEADKDVSPLSAVRAEADALTVQALGESFRRVYPYGHGMTKASVSGVIHTDESELPTDVFAHTRTGEEDESAGDDRAAARGSAYHKWMQWVDFDGKDEWTRLCALFPAEATLIRREEIETAFRAVKEFIGGRKFYRERSFVLCAPAAKVDPLAKEDGRPCDDVLVQGIVDLLVENADGSVEIVDYKTGKEAYLRRPTYVRQLAWYRAAVEKILGREVRAAYIYGFSCGKFLQVPAEKTGLAD